MDIFNKWLGENFQKTVPKSYLTDASRLLSKPQPNLNTTVGFDLKMALHTPPPTPYNIPLLAGINFNSSWNLKWNYENVHKLKN